MPFEARRKGVTIGTYTTREQAVLALNEFISKSKPLDSFSATYSQIYDEWKAIHYPNISQKTAKSYKVEDSVGETLTYCDFPFEHWTRIRTNNVIE